MPTDLRLFLAIAALAALGDAVGVALYLAIRPDPPPALRRVRRWLVGTH